MIDFLSELTRSVGRKNDASSATGSAHAKLTAILARLPAAGISATQYGTIAMVAGETSKTATIASVDTTRSAVLFLGLSTNAAAGIQSEILTRVSLTNATTVTATRALGGTYATTVAFVVLTFVSVVSLQQATVTIVATAASGTATISAVVVARTVLLWQGQTGTLDTTNIGRITLTNTTTVTADRVGTAADLVIGFVAVEF